MTIIFTIAGAIIGAILGFSFFREFSFIHGAILGYLFGSVLSLHKRVTALQNDVRLLVIAPVAQTTAHTQNANADQLVTSLATPVRQQTPLEDLPGDLKTSPVELQHQAVTG